MNAPRRSRPVIHANKDVRAAGPSADRLDLLKGEFDALFANQQTAAAGAGMKRAFDAGPKRMGKIAAAAARKGR